MMPVRADMLAATPKCDRPRGPLSELSACNQPMRYVHFGASGIWACETHGRVMTGLEAAQRADLVPWTETLIA